MTRNLSRRVADLERDCSMVSSKGAERIDLPDFAGLTPIQALRVFDTFRVSLARTTPATSLGHTISDGGAPSAFGALRAAINERHGQS